MSKDQEWGSWNELQALAYALKRTIIVVIAFQKDDVICEPKETEIKLEPILLGYNGNHYCSLVPGTKLKYYKRNVKNQPKPVMVIRYV